MVQTVIAFQFFQRKHNLHMPRSLLFSTLPFSSWLFLLIIICFSVVTYLSFFLLINPENTFLNCHVPFSIKLTFMILYRYLKQLGLIVYFASNCICQVLKTQLNSHMTWLYHFYHVMGQCRVTKSLIYYIS